MARPRARPPPPAAFPSFPIAALVLVFSAVSSQAASPSLPQIDFSSLGTVAVVGSFAGLSFYDADNPAPTYSSTRSTLLARTAAGAFDKVAETDDGGSIAAVCQSPDGTVFVGGNFTQIGGVTAANIASYDPAGHAFAAMGNGLTGEVRALACNGTTVYAGGDFTASEGGPNVASWSIGSKAWSALPFYGLDGSVESIFPSADGLSLFFGGSFSTTFSNSSSNSTLASADSSSFPSIGSSLTPISLNSSDYWASPTTYISGFGRPQYIFCPRHDDGVGASWLLVDGQAGYFIARMYRELNVRGIRLGNTFYEGRGTKNFSVVSIPDDQVLTLSYASDPSDPSSALVTCSDNCPLAHNESIPYQDFLFPEGTTLTGFQLNVNGWYGAGGGLHLLQLLSEGSYAYASEADNLSPCTSGLAASTQSTVSTTGTWTTANATTSIAGTTQTVLVGSIDGGNDAASSAPSITWQPYVTEEGDYAVYFTTPGCSSMGDCARRTSVLVTATPSGGTPNSTTIDQTNTATASTLIYNGTLAAGASSLSVSMSLADGAASFSGTTYEIVADYINLVAASTNGSSTRIERGYGLFEYALADQGTFGDVVSTSGSVNASGTMTNASGFDSLAFRLDNGAVVNSVVSVGNGSTTHVFVGGNFTFTPSSSSNTGSSTNVVSYASGQASAAPNGGLNGVVTSLLEYDGILYAAGSFDATTDGAVSELAGIARWNYSALSTKWEALGGTVPSIGGAIAQLAVVNTGSSSPNGSRAIVAVGGGGSGLAFYEPASSAWNSTMAGLFLGNLTAVGPAASLASTNATTYLAGNVLAAVRNSAPGGAVLSSGHNGSPQLSSFGFGFNSSSPSTSSGTTASSSRFRRAESSLQSLARSFAGPLDRRASSRIILEPRAPAPSSTFNLTLPSPISAVASTADSSSTDQVLAGAFWKNGSTTLMLLGGSFTSSTGVQNLGAYDTSKKTFSSLPGAETINGTVTSLMVLDDSLWIGGNFSTGGGRQGFATYDLQGGKVDDSQPPLSGYAGKNATLNVIAQRPGYDSQIVVAGGFASAGSLSCQSICLWDTSSLQWSAMGGGLQGVVGAIDFAGANSEYLVASGEFLLDSSTAYIARWNFRNSSWTGIGAATDLPGPATAVSADDHNSDKIFVAGKSSSSGVPYLAYWNGTAWADLNSNGTLASGSGVQQLAFVPLQSDHSSNDVVESNRMLLVSGDLNINDTSVSTALYDGENWYPYLVATSATGSAGVIAQLFYSVTDFSLSSGHHLAVGIVILISMAIALGFVFLFVLIGLLIALARRKDEPNSYPNNRGVTDVAIETSSAGALHRPTSLLQTVGAATAVLLDPKGEKAFDHDAAGGGAASFDGAVTSYGSDYGDDGEPSTALARYSFHAEHPGELSISANEQLSILEAADPNWWMVVNGAGQRGLVPQTYLA
ncbi:hypothetical protein JCM1841_004401 [Sporobolomyces salmonicolor]